MKERKDIDNKYKWDLSKFYKNNEEIEKEINDVNKLVEQLLLYKDKIGLNANNLSNSLDLYNLIYRKVYKLFTYSNMNFDSEMNNDNNQRTNEMIENFYNAINVKLSFYEVELLTMDYNKVLGFIEENKNIDKYKFYLEKMFRNKKYMLSEKEEKILSKFNSPLSNYQKTYKYLTDVEINFGKIRDENGKTVKINESNYTTYIKSKDRKIRKKAYETLFKKYREYQNSISTLYLSNVKVDNITSDLRGFNSSLESSLYRDNIDIKVYKELIESINNNVDVLQDYINVKRELLDVDKMHFYDIYAPVDINESDNYSYEEAQKIILEALSPMGKDYLEILKKAFNENWIDVYPNVSKRSGAYSWGSYDTVPYILCNYKDNLNSVSTLVHELGHSVHSYLTNKNQDYIYSDYPIFLAEIASTVNEILLSNYLLNNSKNKNEKINLIVNMLDLFRGTVFRQTMFAEFELIIHEKENNGEAMTSLELNSEYEKLVRKYFGNSMEYDSLIKYEWERIPHFYNSFYVYKYATGLIFASSIATDIMNNKPGALNKYIKLLSSGSSNYPLDILKECGYELNDQTINNFVNLNKSYIKQLKQMILQGGSNE